MTELLLKVDHAAKKVTAQGRVAAGEDVALTLDMGAPVDDIGQVRVRLRHLGTDVAVFPWLGEEWTEQTPGAEDGVYIGTWNTNTEELAAIFEDLPDRATHIFDVIVDQVPDDDETDDTCVMYGIGKIRLQKWSPDLTLTDLTEGPHPVTLLAALEGKIGKDELATALDGLADLAANSTQKDIRTKANQIIAILRGLATAAVAFFLGFSAFALPWEEVPPDTTVNPAIVGAEVGEGLALKSGVLSARGGISTNNVEDLIASATNAIPRGRFATDIDGAGHSITNSPMATTNFVWEIVGGITNNLPSGGVRIAWLDGTYDWLGSSPTIDWEVHPGMDGEAWVQPNVDTLIVADTLQDEYGFVTADALSDFAARTNLPPLSASSTIGDLVDAFNAIANALRKEEEEP